jgi:hypothetical protein
VWSASRGNVALTPLNVTDDFQKWVLTIDNENTSFKNVGNNKAIEFVGGDKPVELKPPDSSSNKQKFKSILGGDTSIQSVNTTSRFLVPKAVEGDTLVFDGTDSTEKWKIESA